MFGKNKVRSIMVILALVSILLLSVQVALADPPASSGPNVVRYVFDEEDPFYAWFVVDEKTGYSAIVGADVVADCEGSGDVFDLVYIQEINVPEDDNRIIQLAKNPEITVSVWDFFDFDCDLFTTVDPVATGTADYRYTDNDVYTFLTDDNINANAFGFMANGKLYTPEGERVNFSSRLRIVWDGVDTTKNVNAKVNVH